MAAKQQCDVDFSDSDFLVSQCEGKARRFSQLKGKRTEAAEAVEASVPAEAAGTREDVRVPPWCAVAGKLLILIPFGLLLWFLLVNR